MDVIVPDDQLSLAIGRKGQNVRLAVQLTGWKIDIKSESKMRELAQWLAEAVSVVEGCGEAEADLLLQQGITSLEDLAECDVRDADPAARNRRGGRPGRSRHAGELRKARKEQKATRRQAEAVAARDSARGGGRGRRRPAAAPLPPRRKRRIDVGDAAQVPAEVEG